MYTRGIAYVPCLPCLTCMNHVHSYTSVCCMYRCVPPALCSEFLVGCMYQLYLHFTVYQSLAIYIICVPSVLYVNSDSFVCVPLNRMHHMLPLLHTAQCNLLHYSSKYSRRASYEALVDSSICVTYPLFCMCLLCVA